MNDNLSCNCRVFDERGIGIGLVEKDFSKIKQPLKILALGDVHGDAKAINRLADVLEHARTTESRVLLTGDLLDNKIKDSKSFYHGAEAPYKEIDRYYDLFDRYRHVIDGVVAGNHDERSYKYSGEDSIRRLCIPLGIAYHPDALVIIYKVGSAEGRKNNRHDCGPIIYTIYLSHSTRAGRKEGGKLQKVADFKNITNADVHLAGHSHDLSGCKGSYIDVSKRGVLTMREQVFVNCGSFQDYIGYMVKGNYAPSPKGFATIFLDNKKHHVSFKV